MTWTRSGALRTYSRKAKYQSKLAQQLAPPEPTESPMGCCLGMVIFSAALVVMMLLMLSHDIGHGPAWLGVAICLLIIFIAYVFSKSSKAARRHRVRERHIQDEYDRKWYCFKCGQSFIWRG